MICFTCYAMLQAGHMRWFPHSNISQRAIKKENKTMNNDNKKRTTFQDRLVSFDIWKIALLPEVNFCDCDHVSTHKINNVHSSPPLTILSQADWTPQPIKSHFSIKIFFLYKIHKEISHRAPGILEMHTYSFLHSFSQYLWKTKCQDTFLGPEDRG